MKKSSNISVIALHRFIPQPASGHSSALPCLDCIFTMVRILAIIAFIRLFFHTRNTFTKSKLHQSSFANVNNLALRFFMDSNVHTSSIMNSSSSFWHLLLPIFAPSTAAPKKTTSTGNMKTILDVLSSQLLPQ